MNRDEIWGAIDEQRTRLADVLDQLDGDEWAHPSLCEGWTVREVAAHLARGQLGLREGLTDLVKAHGSVDRALRDAARRHAKRPVEQLIAEIRGMVGSRRHVPTTVPMDPLIDVLVHSQDIALPLGRTIPMPRDAAVAAATRIWSAPRLSATAVSFPGRNRFQRYRLTATDVSWSVGAGPMVRGPMESIVLLLSGRPIALEGLSGEGVPSLAAQL